MRKQLCMLLARYAGQTITKELAVEMLREIFPDRTLEPKAFGTQQYKGYTFEIELLRDILEEIKPLELERYAQDEMGKAGYDFDPDTEDLIEREYAGGLLQSTSRTSEGALVGYMRVYLTRSKDTDTLVCSDAAFYVTPAHRGGFMAVNLWKFTEQCVVAAGAREIYCATKLANNVGSMARRLGYLPTALLYCKVIPNHAQECSEEKEACYG